MKELPSIYTKGLTLAFQNRVVLDGIDLKVARGEIVGITGKSGSGKSSLLNCLSGVIPNILPGEVSGEIRVCGKNMEDMKLPEISTKIGIVFQNPETQIFMHTVEDEVAFGPENLCVAVDELEERITSALEITGMLEHRYDEASKLSGGQKQLVALASVLSMKPSILLLDEVFAHVDKEGKERILPTIEKLAQSGKAILMIDHNMDNLKSCTRVLSLSGGKLEEINL